MHSSIIAKHVGPAISLPNWALQSFPISSMGQVKNFGELLSDGESLLAMSSVLDLDQLLREISPEAPSGDDLEYDPVFGQMERAAQGKPEQEIGETFVEAAEADWKDVKDKAIQVLSRSRDLRAAVYLARATLHTDGLPGFNDSLTVLRESIDRYWESVHPQLDPDDDNDPTIRVNTLIALCDRDATLNPVREAPLVVSRMLGRFSYRDVQAAEGEVPPHGDESPPDMAAILAAFRDCDLDELQTTANAVDASAKSVATIETMVTERVGARQAADLSALTSLLRSIGRLLNEQLQRRGVSSPPEPVKTSQPSPADNGEGPPSSPIAVNGEVHSREDVIRTIDHVCDYYRNYEPSSPIPLLLKRAKRLVNKDFLEILQDLAPDGLSEIQQRWGGLDNGEASQSHSDQEEMNAGSESSGSDGWG